LVGGSKVDKINVKRTYNVSTQKGGKMQRKIFKTGNSLVVSLPKDAIEEMKLSEGTVVNVYYDRVTSKLIVEPVDTDQAVEGIDEEFAQQVSEFIEQYRPALDELAK
jgi:putative addiction module antidote